MSDHRRDSSGAEAWVGDNDDLDSLAPDESTRRPKRSGTRLRSGRPEGRADMAPTLLDRPSMQEALSAGPSRDLARTRLDGAVAEDAAPDFEPDEDFAMHLRRSARPARHHPPPFEVPARPPAAGGPLASAGTTVADMPALAPLAAAARQAGRAPRAFETVGRTVAEAPSFPGVATREGEPSSAPRSSPQRTVELGVAFRREVQADGRQRLESGRPTARSGPSPNSVPLLVALIAGVGVVTFVLSAIVAYAVFSS